MIKKIQKIMIGIAIVGVVGTASHVPAYTALAADSGTVTSNVPCGRLGDPSVDPSAHECTYDDLIVLVQNVIDFVVKYLIIPVIVLVILKAGVKLIISGNKSSAISEAKESLKKSFFGLVFVLTAWLIVNALISSFGVKYNTDTSGKSTNGPIQILGN